MDPTTNLLGLEGGVRKINVDFAQLSINVQEDTENVITELTLTDNVQDYDIFFHETPLIHVETTINPPCQTLANS